MKWFTIKARLSGDHLGMFYAKTRKGAIDALVDLVEKNAEELGGDSEDVDASKLKAFPSSIGEILVILMGKQDAAMAKLRIIEEKLDDKS